MYKAKNQLKLLRIAYAAPACSRQDLRPRKEEVGFIQNRACGGGVYSEWYTREEEEEEEEEEEQEQEEAAAAAAEEEVVY